MREENPRLLVVDDEADQCESLKHCFSRRGFVVFTAITGREALASIKKDKPDLLLLDLKLPDMNGREVLRELREYDKKIKVVIVTGSVLTDQETQELADLGINELIFKPTDIVTLENVIKEALKHGYPKAFHFEAAKPKEEQPADVPLRSIAHELSNVTSDIATKCELYILDTEEGLKKNKTEKERLDEATDILKAVLKQTERLTDIIKKLSSLAKKEI